MSAEFLIEQSHIDYVDQQLRDGYSSEVIKDTLLQSGYTLAQVEAIFAKVTADEVPNVAQKKATTEVESAAAESNEKESTGSSSKLLFIIFGVLFLLLGALGVVGFATGVLDIQNLFGLF